MEIIKIPANSIVKLAVKISSDAVVGSYSSLNDVVIKRSQLYHFKMDLGNINSLDNGVLSSVSNFFVALGDVGAIMKHSEVTYTLKFNGIEKKLSGDKVKINEDLFMAFFIVKLSKV